MVDIPSQVVLRIQMGQLLSAVPVDKWALLLPQRYQSQLAALLPSFWRADTDNNTEESVGRHFDLVDLPPELALAILSHLNPTDLYLASGVWWNLASNEVLWRGLCRAYWPFCSVYETWQEKPHFSFRILFLRLDEARLTFNSDAFEGILYLQENEILKDDIRHVALYLHVTPGLDPVQKRRYLEASPDVLDEVIRLKDFRSAFLPDALRSLFTELPSPENDTHNFIPRLLERFSEHFARCNPHIGLHPDVVYVLCFSLLMLSKDFASPQIKNKMSKREFIRNTRRAVPSADVELLGHFYDNVYMEGDIATWVTVKSSSVVPSASPPTVQRVTGVRTLPRPYRIIALS
ncbi:F-box only protein 8 [Taenia crassiceps]|uniref:F-box only protein 8 n=1 Tax=Taenia crassiceps TaxID=6207 RepID=A0ABR4QSP6_9CEST